MQPWPISIGRQGHRCHGRAEIRPADANIDHIGDLPTLPLKSARAHGIGKFCHPCPRGAHLRHDISAVDHDLGCIACPQSGVQNGAAFGVVDLSPAKHGGALFNQTCSFAQSQKLRQGMRVDVGFGEIKQHSIGVKRKGLRALAIKQAQYRTIHHLGVMGLKGCKTMGHGSTPPNARWLGQAPCELGPIRGEGSGRGQALCAFRGL